jgi:hypothetical protein
VGEKEGLSVGNKEGDKVLEKKIQSATVANAIYV